jgi:hypothetical protein
MVAQLNLSRSRYTNRRSQLPLAGLLRLNGFASARPARLNTLSATILKVLFFPSIPRITCATVATDRDFLPWLPAAVARRAVLVPVIYCGR